MRSETRIDETPCPHCGHRIDRASGFGFGRESAPTPHPGDWSLCISCAGLLVFRDDLTPRAATAEEERQASAHPRVRRYREALAKVKRRGVSEPKPGE